ncbi:MAG: GntR family transcriptional regulator [Acidimicrobiales bacterium]
MSENQGSVMPGRRELDRTSPVPLWIQVRDDLLSRLDTGEISEDFPGEMALVAEYGISRNTVRQAVGHLREAGVVAAARGRRPRVIDTGTERAVGILSSLFESVEHAGLPQFSKVRAVGLTVWSPAAALLGRHPSSQLFYLERLRLADGHPLALDHLWMPAEIGSPLLDADFSRTSVYGELARRTGQRVTSGREEICAVVPDDHQCSLLGIGPRIGAVVIERIGCAAGEPIEYRKTLVRGDRFRATAEFSAVRGYRFHPGVPPAPGRRSPR